MSTNPGQYAVRLPDGDEVLVEIRFDRGQYVARIDGTSHRLSLRHGPNGDLVVDVDDRTYRVNGANGASTLVGESVDAALGLVSAMDAGQLRLRTASLRPQLERAPVTRRTIDSPLTGLVIEVCVSPGQAVERGQTLVVIEAMKMENRIGAPHDGRVAEVAAKKGATVRLKDPLLTLVSE